MPCGKDIPITQIPPKGANALAWVYAEAKKNTPEFDIHEYDEEDDTWYVMVIKGEPIFHNLLD